MEPPRDIGCPLSPFVCGVYDSKQAHPSNLCREMWTCAYLNWRLKNSRRWPITEKYPINTPSLQSKTLGRRGFYFPLYLKWFGCFDIFAEPLRNHPILSILPAFILCLELFSQKKIRFHKSPQQLLLFGWLSTFTANHPRLCISELFAIALMFYRYNMTIWKFYR